MNKNIDEILKEVVEKKIDDYNWYLNYLLLQIQQLQMKQTLIEEELELYKEFLRHLNE